MPKKITDGEPSDRLPLGEAFMRLATFGSVLLLATAMLPALDLMSPDHMLARAQAAAPLTEQEQDYETLKRMLEKRNPDLASKIDRKLKEIDAGQGTEQQKEEAKDHYLVKQLTKALEADRIARGAGVGTEASKEIAHILDGMLRNQDSVLRNKGFIQFGATRFSPSILGEELSAEFKTTAAELEEERKKAAENKGQDGGIAPEHSRADGGKPSFEVALGGTIGERDAPKQRYLATEIGGLLRLGVIGQDRTVTETSWDVALRYAGEFSGFRVADGSSYRRDPSDFFNPGNLVHELKFGGSYGSSSESLDDFDPGAGVGLGIPGVGDGTFPAGIFLLDLPGFSNDVIGSWGRYEVDSYELGYRAGYEFDVGASSSLQPFIGLGYRHTSEKQSFGGGIPGYGIDFKYDTRIKLDTFKTELGFRLEHQLSDSFSIFGEPSASLNFICLDGWDGLELSGLVSDSQRVNLDESETLPGVRLAVGFDWEPEASPLSIYFGATIAHEPTTATVFRSGETGEQSEADVKYSTSYSLNASISFKF